MKRKFKIKISIWQLLALGYLTVILIGSVLLVLPWASKSGETSYLDALFTSVSATCVTGLAVHNTSEHWTLFGQIVILILIQVGGLGFMTFVTSVFYILKKDVSLYGRKALMATAGIDRKYLGLGKLVKRILIGSAIFEAAGAFALCFRFVPDFGWGNGIYYSVWHSVSAFCNAGFDLIGTNGGCSITSYAKDPLVTVTLGLLIIIGGLGFYVWSDILDSRLKPKKLQFNTKVVLTLSAALIVLSCALFTVFEWNNPSYTDYNFGEKLLVSFFNAVTPRTAGFSTTDPTTLSESGYALTLLLMFVGGNSGSTAGGIKVGTLAVIVTGMIASLRGNSDIDLGRKRLAPELLSQALAIFVACLSLIVLSTIAICAFQPSLTIKEVVFECVSALGTVGLTLNVTDKLLIPSKIIIMLLMYTGRVGILTLTLALGESRTTAKIRKPIDSILIG